MPIQKPSVATAIASTTGTKIPDTRSASRCTGALPDCASVTSRPIWASGGVGAHPRRADDEAAAGVDGRAGHLVAGLLLDGHGLARQQRLVDRRGAGLDHPVGGDLLARADDEAVADGERLDGNAPLAAVSTEHGDVLAPSSSSAFSAEPARCFARASK